ncbi:MAG: helix-turn-helix domain-containing protein, partial [Acidimicrobiales bacterium]
GVDVDARMAGRSHIVVHARARLGVGRGRRGADRRRPGLVGDPARKRERELLRLVASGANNAEIAESLYVSERRVKGHISAIFAKLGVRDRPAAIIRAYDAGIVTPRA